MLTRLLELVSPVGWASIGGFALVCAWLVWHGTRVRRRGETAEERSTASTVGGIYIGFAVAMVVALILILLVTAWLTRGTSGG